MSPICRLLGCRPDKEACRCLRCGRAMHAWQRTGESEVWAELRGISRQGKMRYLKTALHTQRCAVCGRERRQTLIERVEH